MNRNLAGSDLSPSGVHALLLLQSHKGLTAGQLSDQLLLEKSTVSRLVRSLVQRGEITELPSQEDRRIKHLDLTGRGRLTLARINQFAEERVQSAIKVLDTHSRQSIVNGLEAYAQALEASRSGAAGTAASSSLRIVAGYQPGLIGQIVTLHAVTYNKLEGFGLQFEATVSDGLAKFAPRLGNDKNQVWSAWHGEQFVGSIAIDGENLGEGIAHLRWFIVAEDARGTGLGRRLLEAAVTHCRMQEFAEIKLWTFKGLDAARRLYERNGFILTEEYNGDQWGHSLTEQIFVKSMDRRQSP
ncbi:bifunctional helix-turn-helix transcriptional regulator/GNAT family N-acetyltransferase [Hoeflea prorocentri]|uniref:Helix-turn-helix domain-containing GNAT family N-acetyltransferase n=1 Tax=Hoeflea prorocentri TaxID=1922333 RepID=A0A9X3UI75_9HYPH|nr:helix-turn-helix domain-containing GNAT family N-acetyltransferase [Hoeflea prorocentri]MCY6381071.1 helix-turn-helix domain-containing GNAT family N-acetyltransferase [Hoeflea prorocentri]MDA5398871.1 helix-turn-helix domain-containing GNAT family N-acetyltransferase [Hoeflea prorocentri]